MKLDIHNTIKNKLDFFLKDNNVPNIVFYGPSGTGKRTLVYDFIYKIYNNNIDSIQNYVIAINCAHGKGIKFIRDELKFFAKIHTNKSNTFKTILLINADKLTIDAQSALRRCIELFSNSTRFFIIVEDKYKLLAPILSRFCEIYVPEPEIGKKVYNLNTYVINNLSNSKTSKKEANKELLKLGTLIEKTKVTNLLDVCKLSKKLYEKGFSAIDIIKYITNKKMNEELKYKLIMTYHDNKIEYRNEKQLMIYILYFLLIRSDFDLENITFM
jgi:replication-associated recombination protein RarA